MATIPIILDCDPGHDDALAIVLALARPELRLLAITTVAGNAPLDRTTRTALRVLTLLGRTDVPVAAGADRPLVREPWVPVEFHGDSGLDGADLPADGGQPALTPQVAAKRRGVARRAREDARRPVCPTCNLELPATGQCDFCA